MKTRVWHQLFCCCHLSFYEHNVISLNAWYRLKHLLKLTDVFLVHGRCLILAYKRSCFFIYLFITFGMKCTGETQYWWTIKWRVADTSEITQSRSIKSSIKCTSFLNWIRFLQKLIASRPKASLWASLWLYSLSVQIHLIKIHWQWCFDIISCPFSVNIIHHVHAITLLTPVSYRGLNNNRVTSCESPWSRYGIAPNTRFTECDCGCSQYYWDISVPY